MQREGCPVKQECFYCAGNPCSPSSKATGTAGWPIRAGPCYRAGFLFLKTDFTNRNLKANYLLDPRWEVGGNKSNIKAKCVGKKNLQRTVSSTPSTECMDCPGLLSVTPQSRAQELHLACMLSASPKIHSTQFRGENYCFLSSSAQFCLLSRVLSRKIKGCRKRLLLQPATKVFGIRCWTRGSCLSHH